MPKRKRNTELSLHEKLEQHHVEIFRALKVAKGFERQRLAKRLHESGITGDKKDRLDREVSVLKSLDLLQTARAHLYSSLVKVKSIAASTDLPDDIRAGVPRPELSEEEQAALHNVTSGLYNKEPVKQAVDRAIESACQSLGVPVPEKGAKRSRKSKREEKEEQPSEQIDEAEVKEKEVIPQAGEAEYEDVTDFEGFQSDVDEPGPAVGGHSSGSEDTEDDDDDESDDEEMGQYNDRLGSSSGEDEDDFVARLRAKFGGREKANVDDISVSGSGAESDEEGEGDEDEEDISAARASCSPSPPAKKSKKEASQRKPAESKIFLPSLMGGYLSGSESASDIEDEISAPKKRRGQRQRQAIWEKKFGAKAKHLESQRQGKGRDAGWDMKRGAVDGGNQRTPWKQGVTTPFLTGANAMTKEAKPKVRKKDDEGPLHPSWEAKKKAKASEKTAAFSGSKIVFD